MREKLKGKLRSRRGATLLLSLLLFLVCAMAGSVAITAGTASSGTVSERAKMDQRYFSVTSAAELLRKKLDGLSVRISNSTIRIYDTNNNDVTDSLPELTNLLTDQTLYLISVFDDTQEEQDRRKQTAEEWLSKPPYDNVIVSITDNNVVDKDTLEARMKTTLEVTVKISRVALGTMDFTIESAIKDDNGNPENEKFRLKMEYAAMPVPVDDGYTVTWNVKSIGLPN